LEQLGRQNLKRVWSWLPADEQWRIGYAYTCLRFFPTWIFEFINRGGHNLDFDQIMQLAVFETLEMEPQAASRVIQKEVRSFLTSIMVRKRGGQWKAVEFSRSQKEMAVSDDYDVWEDVKKLQWNRRGMVCATMHRS
jgi:hypothetical protein